MLHSAYDPYITGFNGTLWVAFECAVDVGGPVAVSTCVAPVSRDLSHIDLSRLTVPIRGRTGPYQNHPRKSVMPDDPITTLVQDVVPNDPTSNHVAAITYAQTVQKGILELSSIGGTAGGVVCHSTHEESPGCWRIGVSLGQKPLAHNAYGEHKLPKSLVPGNVVEYPRFVTGPGGKHFLMGLFLPPHGTPRPDYAPPLPGRPGLVLYPLDPTALIQ